MNINSAQLLSLLASSKNLKDLEKNQDKVEKALEKFPPDLKEFSQGKELKILFQEIVSKGIDQTTKKGELLRSLTNLKPLFELETFKSEIKQLQENLQKNPIFKSESSEIKNILLDIKNISRLNSQELEEKIQNSGIQYESKLKNIISQENQPILPKSSEPFKTLTADFKYNLQTIIEKLESNDTIEQLFEDDIKVMRDSSSKLLNQIEFYQAYSFFSNSFATFIPFSWDELKDGQMQFSVNKEKTFTCQIDLDLQYLGKIKIYMILDNKNNLQIDFGIEDEKFLKLISTNLQSLRQSFFALGLKSQEIHLFSLKKLENEYEKNLYDQSRFCFGVDLKA
jgi:hypothetical protein